METKRSVQSAAEHSREMRAKASCETRQRDRMSICLTLLCIVLYFVEELVSVASTVCKGQLVFFGLNVSLHFSLHLSCLQDGKMPAGRGDTCSGLFSGLT